VNTLRTVLKRSHLVTLVLAIAIVPIAAGSASAATKQRDHKTAVTTATAKHAAAKRAAVKRAAAQRAAAKRRAAVTSAVPAPVPADVNSVISIGGYVFYNLTYAEAADAYAAAVAAAPAGYTPPPVTSVSVVTTVGNG
jgi:hypothetical protein